MAAADYQTKSNDRIRVCAVVINYFGAEKTEKCIHSLLGEHLDTIYLVDNSATVEQRNAVAEIISGAEKAGTATRFFQANSGQNLGFGRAINSVVSEDQQQGGHDYYLVMNNDAQATPGLLQALLSVALADSRRVNVSAARMEGLPAYFGEILSQEVLDKIDLHGIGRLLAVTSNAEANSLAAIHFIEVFGRKEVYQLALDKGDSRSGIEPVHLKGRVLFSPKANYELLEKLFGEGAEVKASRMTDKFDIKAFKEYYGEGAIPLFVLTKAEGEVSLTAVAAGQSVKPRPGQVLISVIPGETLRQVGERAKAEKTEKPAAETKAGEA